MIQYFCFSFFVRALVERGGILFLGCLSFNILLISPIFDLVVPILHGSQFSKSFIRMVIYCARFTLAIPLIWWTGGSPYLKWQSSCKREDIDPVVLKEGIVIIRLPINVSQQASSVSCYDFQVIA